MLMYKHECLDRLFKYEKDNECKHLIKETVNSDEPTENVIRFLINQNEDLPVVEHYSLLNKKAHKIIKEIMNCEGKDVATYIKIATSLITQGTITLEHKFKDDIKGANTFIRCTRLPELSEALSLYFSYGNFNPLVEEINLIKKDIKIIINL